MRHVRIGVTVGALLALVVGVSGVHALWGRSETVPAGVTLTGDLAVSASWLGGSPVWAPLYPGSTTPDATLRVTGSGSGSTLGWRVQITSTVATQFAAYTTFQARECVTGTVIPAGGYPASGSLPAGAVVDVCVHYTLASNAPGTLQGQQVSPRISVVAQQVGG